jgi:uncharacterized protein
MEVRHLKAERRFELDTEAGPAVLEYAREEDGTFDLRHTLVPEAVRGRGIGAALVRGALDLIRPGGDRVRPSCPFVRSWTDANPGYRDMVANGSGEG